MKNCIFCKIIKGEIPSFKIYEDEEFLAFLDISQFTRGHTIVIPKKHVEFVWDYSDAGKYFEIVSKIANHFKKLGYRYVDSMIFGRGVAHAHIHLIPHNDDAVDYKKALEGVNKLADETRRPSKEEYEKTIEEFNIKNEI